jgi:hypothetical protein
MFEPLSVNVEFETNRRRFLTATLVLPLLVLLPASTTSASAPRERPLRSLTAAELRRPHDLAG